MMKWDGLNRRQFPRIVYPCMVKVISQGHVVEAILTHTENIGVGGVGVIIKKELKLFEVVGLEIDLIDEEDHIVTSGKVVWVVKRKAEEAFKPMFYDVGIEFQGLSSKNKSRLEAATDKFIKKGFKVLKPVY